MVRYLYNMNMRGGNSADRARRGAAKYMIAQRDSFIIPGKGREELICRM